METGAMRVLMVDDETNILEIYARLLEEEGHAVRTASHPDEALRWAARERFDVAFVDQFLGLDRGIDLMARLCALDPELPCVIMTANGTTDLAVDALKAGATDFIGKPFKLGDLLRSMEYADRKRDLDRQKRALVTVLERSVKEKTEELRRVYVHVLSSLAQAMEKRDIGTYGHSKRVAYYARLIAAALDLGEQDRFTLKTAALLHDIGKIGISDFILGKKGPLTEEEMEEVKSHPRKGVEILQPLSNFEPILPAILHHHEHFNGDGYPNGLSGEMIPLHARIIAVADTYDAILATRPYRTGMDHDAAMRELSRCAGKQFDPAVVDAFVEADRRYRLLIPAAGEAAL